MKRRKIHYDPHTDFYTLMGIPPQSNAEAIQQAYRKRAKELHPDLNPDRVEWATAQFQLLNEAYAVLSDPDTRREYNNLRWLHGPQPTPPPRSSARPRSSSNGTNWWDEP
ncbi:MAG: J domain-containing protein, partial [Anaerolineae bacterium]|nr:J domain-containing protein [Anaerolineae bacterium]